MSVENASVRTWRAEHRHRLVPPDLARPFFEHLNTHPWGLGRLRWSQVPHTFVPFSDGDPQPSWVERFAGTPVARHGSLLVAYAPGREALVGGTSDVLADIDLLYAGAPGARYFCGVDLVDDVPVPVVEDFAEFSDGGVTVRLG